MRVFTDLHGRDEPPLSSWEEPRLGEPGHGYVARLLAMTGGVSVRALLDAHGLHGRSIRPDECLEFALSFPIKEKDKLVAATPVVGTDRVSLLGQEMRRKHWQISERRFCPACLAEDAYHRAWWDVAAFRHCPDHRLDITSRDDKGLPVPWWCASFERSPAGHGFVRHGVPRVSKRSPSLETYLLGRFGVAEAVEAPFLDALPFLGDVIDVVELLGRVSLGGTEHRRPVVGQGKGLDRTRVLRAGFDLAARGETGILAKLRAIAEARAGSHGRGRAACLGWFAEALKEETGAYVGPLEKLVLEIVLERGEFSTTTRELWEAGAGEWLPVSTVARKLGLSDERVRRIAETLGFHERQFGSPSVRYRVLSKEQADRIEQAVATSVSRSEAANLLGLDLSAFSALVTAGQIRPFTVIGSSEGRDRFRPEDVTGFMPGSMACHPVLDIVPADCVRLGALRRTCKTNPAGLIAEAVAGRVEVIGRTGESLGDIVVRNPRRPWSMANVRAALKTLPGTGRYDVATRYGDRVQVVDALVDVGILKRLPGRTKAWSRIDASSAETACAEWAPPSVYKDTVGVTPGLALVQELRSRGIRMIDLKLYDGSSTVCVHRASARRLLGLSHDPDDQATGSKLAFETLLLCTLAKTGDWKLVGRRAAALTLRTARNDRRVRLVVDMEAAHVAFDPTEAGASSPPLVAGSSAVVRPNDGLLNGKTIPAPELRDCQRWPSLILSILNVLSQHPESQVAPERSRAERTPGARESGRKSNVGRGRRLEGRTMPASANAPDNCAPLSQRRGSTAARSRP